ncbi:MAG TPA: disulfide bond formation protein DsbA [Gammaproteobacteria bacterium]|uniref:2-hydroxychromene-2-carboxylate isomerase n=1 Tax=Immundisolibacter sp. TaxID=1934948 RepID=UPI000E968453|nr:disulfide bond formation protein DsbA [Gammaproteobacteria bacterium]HCZ49565.1 disulfide bond formation protein DsbA [Gammaproteobacteria bacterium]MCH79003.1 disulfide bond formation protein DsbA [Gammaproteobacteria bacterium]
MSTHVPITVFFNFRSPYCYLASKSMFDLLDRFDCHFEWRPLGGWQGRSSPERAKGKLPIARQDVRRWCRRLDIPFNPPPVTTDPTRAGAGSLLAEQQGRLRQYVVEVMHAEWGEGRDIGDLDVLRDAGRRAGLDPDELAAASEDPTLRARLEEYWEQAQTAGVFGVPTFLVGEEIFWGNDRIDFLAEHLTERGAAR